MATRFDGDILDISERTTLQSADKGDERKERRRIETRKPREYRNTGANEVQKYRLAKRSRPTLGYHSSLYTGIRKPMKGGTKFYDPESYESETGNTNGTSERGSGTRNGEGPRFTMLNPVYDH